MNSGSLYFVSGRVGSVANVTCDPGYFNRGDDQYTCGPNGTWQGQPMCGKFHMTHDSVLLNKAVC